MSNQSPCGVDLWGKVFLGIVFSLPPIYNNLGDLHKMDYVKKVKKLEAHLAENPTDYQAVVATLKARSKMIESERDKRMAKRIADVEKYRRMFDEESNVK